MKHIASGHIKGGARVSSKKSLFPSNMTSTQVEKTIRDAYKQGKRMSTQGDTIVVEGNGIRMYVNKATKVIETAFPIK